jgi:hypothetical protein
MAERGTLRIYLGAAPGVGKTHAMLSEGHRRAERARDWAQLFGRKDGMYNFDNPDLPTAYRELLPPEATPARKTHCGPNWYSRPRE